MSVGTAPGGVEGWADPASRAGQGRLPRAPGGSPGSRRYEKALTSVRKFGAAAPFEGVRAGPPFPYLRWSGPCIPEWGGQDGPPRSVLPRALEGAGEVGRKRRGDVDDLLRDRVREGQARGVEELALEAEEAGAAVLGVPGDGMPDRLEVRADLVRAARLQPHPQQRVGRQRALRLEVGDGGATLGGVGRDPRP